MSLLKASPLPKALYVPLPSFLCFTVPSTSEITLFSDDLFTLPVFFIADSPLKQCLASSWCSIIVKHGRGVRGQKSASNQEVKGKRKSSPLGPAWFPYPSIASSIFFFLSSMSSGVSIPAGTDENPPGVMRPL